jgi:hypothetical protein
LSWARPLSVCLAFAINDKRKAYNDIMKTKIEQMMRGEHVDGAIDSDDVEE